MMKSDRSHDDLRASDCGGSADRDSNCDGDCSSAFNMQVIVAVTVMVACCRIFAGRRTVHGKHTLSGGTVGPCAGVIKRVAVRRRQSTQTSFIVRAILKG